MQETTEVTEDIEQHLSAIERHARAARGEQIDMTPWAFVLPTRQQLRNMRKACGLSREDVAAETGYHASTVANYENSAKHEPGRAFIQQCLRLYKREWPR